MNLFTPSGDEYHAPIELCVRTSGAASPQLGERLGLGFDATQAIVFRDDTGDRLI